MTTFNVTNAVGLNSAISTAKAGDVIVLAPGNYGNVKIAWKSFTAPVTIMSANGADMAHFDRLALDNVSNVTLKQIDIGGARQVGETSTFVATVQNSRNVTLDGLHVHGTLDNDPTTDLSGISIRGGSDTISVVNTEFEQLFRGVWVQRSQNIQLAGNYLHDIRCDGFVNSAVKNILIEGNRFTNFHKQLDDHSDAIQFWSSNETTASTDITIRNNQVMQGSGTHLQGVFMRDESNAMPYERVLIENNLVYESGYANGITVIGGKDVTMRGNTVLGRTNDSVATWIRLENITGAAISKNVTDQFSQFGTNSGIIFNGNITLKTAPSYVSLLESINSGSTATIEGLLLDGVGYQLTASTEKVAVEAPVLDGTAPSAAGGAADVAVAAQTHTASVTYADGGSGLDASTIGIDDLSVAGPGGVTIQSASAVTNGDGSVTATYVLGSENGFTAADNGTHSISLNAGSVKDKAGNGIAAVASLDTFAVDIDGTAPTVSGGAVDVTVAAATHTASVTYADSGSGLDASTIGVDDVSIAGPGGVTVQSASAVTNGDGSVTATYVLASESGFTAADNGAHTVSLNAGSVMDKAGNGIAATALDMFAVNIDGTAPAASGGAADVTAAAATHIASVTYADNGSGLDASTIGVDDLSIAGPGGVTVQSAFAVTNGDGSVTANYVLASASGFTTADNGTHSIALNAGSVKDKAGNGVAGVSSFDTFAVNIPKTATKSVFGRPGSKKSSSLQKVAVVPTAEPLPSSFSAGGLYTDSFSYSGTSTVSKSAPLPSSAGTLSLFRGFRQAQAQFFHA